MPRNPKPDDGENPSRASTLPGSKPLANFKHERFVNLLARGFTVAEAWAKLGYSEFINNAYRLKGSPKVAARLKFLLDRAAEKSIVDASYIKDQMARVVELALATEINEHGQEVLGPTGNLSAANRALELLGREAGIFKDRIELGGQVSVGNTDLLRKLPPQERSAIKEILLGALARPTPANDDAPVDETGNAQGGVVPAAK